MRRTKASLIYRKTKNLRAVQILLGPTKLESTVRYLGIEVESANSGPAHPAARTAWVEPIANIARRVSSEGHRPHAFAPGVSPSRNADACGVAILPVVHPVSGRARF